MLSLLKEQLEMAQTEMDARLREFLAGRGTLDISIGASLRLLQAELDLCQNQSDRLASLQVHLQRMTIIVRVNQLRFDAARIPIMDLAQSKFFLARAGIWIERVKAGERLGPWDV